MNIARKAKTISRVSATLVASLKPYDVERTLIVSGSPRSGTTWVAQLISQVIGGSVLFEPLHPRQVPSARKAGFGWHTYVRPEETWRAGQRFIARALRGRIINRWTTRLIDPVGVLKSSNWVVKFVRANLILPWIVQHFSVRASILIVRHPCAVIASQLAAAKWENATPAMNAIKEASPHLVSIASSVSSLEEILALNWSISQIVPLSSSVPLTVVTYESLVGSADRFRSFFRSLGLQDATVSADRLDHPSAMASRSLRRETTAARALDRWQDQLSPHQIESILEVTHSCGLDFYSDELLPDLTRLNTWPAITSTSGL